MRAAARPLAVILLGALLAGCLGIEPVTAPLPGATVLPDGVSEEQAVAAGQAWVDEVLRTDFASDPTVTGLVLGYVERGTWETLDGPARRPVLRLGIYDGGSRAILDPGAVHVATCAGGLQYYLAEGAWMVDRIDVALPGCRAPGSEAGSPAIPREFSDPGRLASVTRDEQGRLVGGYLKRHADGTAADTYLTLDAEARVHDVRYWDNDVEIYLTFSYGTRTPLEVPAEAQRVPVRVLVDENATAASRAWRIVDATAPVPFADLEVLVENRTGGPARRVPFGVDADLGDVRVAFVDEKKDGALGPGDGFELVGERPPRARLWDRWADAEAGVRLVAA